MASSRIRVATVAVLLCWWPAGALAQPASDLVFPTSGSAAAQTPFLEGVAWLHSFEYERALDAFSRAQAIDHSFAMAYWGEAMCFHQFLWLNEDLDAGRRALARIPAGAVAAATERERRYFAAAHALFGDGDRGARVGAYASAMERLAADYPDDAEAAVFHGLARLATTARGLVDPGHEGAERHGLVGSGTQQEVAAIFEKVLRVRPRHPGALHYLIHTYDDPAHAERALGAAQLYPDVAPEASHALHMPAHIFLQLGMWREASDSDDASFRASDAWVRRENLPIAVRDYHSLSWLTYEYLQQGRYAEAEATLALVRPAAAEDDQHRLKTLEATMQARIAVEAERWHHVEGPHYRNVDELLAIGLGAAARGRLANAEIARQRLTETAARQSDTKRRTLFEIMQRQVAAAIRLRDGRSDEAVSVMREALVLDARLPPPMGPPEPIKPAPELFGEILLALRRPVEAAAQFDATLQRWRNRSRSVLGLARSAAMAGDNESARAHYRRFLDNWHSADADRPELTEARLFLAGSATATLRSFWLAVIAAGATLAVATVVVLKRRKPQADRAGKKKGRPRRRP